MVPSCCDRRAFLKKSLLFGLAAGVPVFLDRTSQALARGLDPRALDGRPDRILVMLQLSGGNDGLNTVVPFADSAYYAARPALAIKEADVLRLGDHVGLHPKLTGLSNLWKDGTLAVIQGVSYPNPNRSHFESMDIWHSADAEGRVVQHGWIGRLADRSFGPAGDPETLVAIGKSVPRAMQGPTHKPVAFEDPAGYRWVGRPDQEDPFEKMMAKAESDQSHLDFLRQVATDARTSSERIRKAAASYKSKAEYPTGRNLGASLRTVASLIAGGLPTRVYYVSMGGFDTHVQQRQRHEQLMNEFSTGLSAFLADLRAQNLDRNVLVCVFSEFGRRVAENGSAGTDHGVAGPMFLAGAPVKGGLYGKHPSLTDLAKGDLKMEVDFRSVYATVIDGWLKADAGAVLGRDWPLIEGILAKAV